MSQHPQHAPSSSIFDNDKIDTLSADIALNNHSIDWFGTFDDLGAAKDFTLASPFPFSPLHSLNSGKRSITFQTGVLGAFSPGLDAFNGSLMAPFSGGSAVGSASSINRGLEKNEIVQKKVNNKKFFNERSNLGNEPKIKRKKLPKDDKKNYNEFKSDKVLDVGFTYSQSHVMNMPIPHLLKSISGKEDGKGSLSTLDGTPLTNFKRYHFVGGHFMKSDATTKLSKGKRELGTMKCNCKKSRCLKLYCECFSAKRLCDNCNCIDCSNIEGSDELKAKLEKNKEEAPIYFTHPPIAKQATTSSGSTKISEMAHNLICNCRQSMCLKKYCECYQKTLYCSSFCKCTSCKNNPRENPNDGEGDLSLQIPFANVTTIINSSLVNETPTATLKLMTINSATENSGGGGGNDSELQIVGNRNLNFASPSPIIELKNPRRAFEIIDVKHVNDSHDIRETDQSPKKKNHAQGKVVDVVYPFFGKNNPQQSKITALRIFDFLDSKGIYNCSLVNKLWCNAATDDALWE